MSIWKHDLSLGPNGNVELSLQIFAIKSIEAGSIEIEELCRPQVRRLMSAFSFGVVKLLRMLSLKVL